MRFPHHFIVPLVAAALIGPWAFGDRIAKLASFPQRVGQVPVVLVVFDALHGKHLGYPRETTPNLDALAAEGLSFRTALSPAPYTLAGIASLVTGLLPDIHGLVHKAEYSEEEAAMMGALGYTDDEDADQ